MIVFPAFAWIHRKQQDVLGAGCRVSVIDELTCSRCHIKMSSPWNKIRREEMITELISALLKHRRPHKMFPHYKIAPGKSLPPADNVLVKIRSARSAARRGEFLPVNCRPGGDFSRGRSYNGTPACSSSRSNSIKSFCST